MYIYWCVHCSANNCDSEKITSFIHDLTPHHWTFRRYYERLQCVRARAAPVCKIDVRRYWIVKVTSIKRQYNCKHWNNWQNVASLLVLFSMIDWRINLSQNLVAYRARVYQPGHENHSYCCQARYPSTLHAVSYRAVRGENDFWFWISRH